jgi:hypothetical protein
MMLEAFPSRQEFMTLLEELRAFREDSNRRFEAMDCHFEELRTDMNRRFEAVDRRFEAVLDTLRSHDKQMRDMNVHLSSLGGRVGHGLETDGERNR